MEGKIFLCIDTLVLYSMYEAGGAGFWTGLLEYHWNSFHLLVAIMSSRIYVKFLVLSKIDPQCVLIGQPLICN